MKAIVQQIDWAEVGQIVLQGLITLAVLTYLAGWYLGRWLHRANDQLARFWVQLVVPARETGPGTPNLLSQLGSEPARETAPCTQVAPMLHPMAAVASELLELTAAELRAVLGTRQRCSQAQPFASLLERDSRARDLSGFAPAAAVACKPRPVRAFHGAPEALFARRTAARPGRPGWS